VRKNNAEKKCGFRKKIILFITKLAVFLAVIGGIFLFLLYKYYKYNIPTIDTIISQNNKRNINIFYSNNVNKIKTYNSTNISNLTFSDIPSHLVDALVATEDKNFFKHGGIDYGGIIRAIVVNIRSGRLKQGGSTITQQLSKMILNDSRKTFRRKFKELVLTREIEKYLTKQDIIALYLTKSYFGAGKYGVREASRFYFGKEIEELQLEECAMLVGLLKAPTKYNPTNDKELTRARTTQVILNMQRAGFIKDNDILSHVIPDLDFDTYKQSRGESQNYYFADWIYNQLNSYNLDDNLTEVSIITTLNENIQNRTISTVDEFVRDYADRIKNSELAVLIMDKNGEILSMIGGKNYNKSSFNRSVFAYRQTGSLFKLFVYLAGFENGLKVSDVFVDEPIKIADWYPENNNSKYYGKIAVKDAFAISSNSVAVQIADYFGIREIVKVARKLGLTANFKNDLTISLGSQESNLLEMTAAYAVVANGGIPVFSHGIKYITSNNKPIYKRNISEKNPVLKPNTIENMQYLLYLVVEDGTGRGAKIESLANKTKAYNLINSDNKFFIGGKTGSTQGSKDAWFIGFANDYVIGIWFGNDDNSPTNKIMGGNLPALLWKRIAEELPMIKNNL
jgi:penicillin-binding protein 1A